jgi:hypothetical protein
MEIRLRLIPVVPVLWLRSGEVAELLKEPHSKFREGCFN